jgi:hypothetical protein
MQNSLLPPVVATHQNGVWYLLAVGPLHPTTFPVKQNFPLCPQTSLREHHTESSARRRPRQTATPTPPSAHESIPAPPGRWKEFQHRIVYVRVQASTLADHGGHGPALLLEALGQRLPQTRMGSAAVTNRASILAATSFDAHPRFARLPDAAEPRPHHADQQESTQIKLRNYYIVRLHLTVLES